MGLVKSCLRSMYPPLMSPPTRLGFHRSRSAVPATSWPEQDPETGCKRSICASILGSCRKSSRLGRGSRPRRCACLRGARLVEEALLGEQDERSLGVLPARRRPHPPRPRRACRRGGRCRPTATLGRPGDGPVEREVHLEDAGAVAVAFEGAVVTLGEVLPGDVEELARCYIEEYRAGSWRTSSTERTSASV